MIQSPQDCTRGDWPKPQKPSLCRGAKSGSDDIRNGPPYGNEPYGQEDGPSAIWSHR
jgi:hypothetical protein